MRAEHASSKPAINRRLGAGVEGSSQVQAPESRVRLRWAERCRGTCRWFELRLMVVCRCNPSIRLRCMGSGIDARNGTVLLELWHCCDCCAEFSAQVRHSRLLRWLQLNCMSSGCCRSRLLRGVAALQVRHACCVLWSTSVPRSIAIDRLCFVCATCMLNSVTVQVLTCCVQFFAV